jgi:hypothetical protein
LPFKWTPFICFITLVVAADFLTEVVFLAASDGTGAFLTPVADVVVVEVTVFLSPVEATPTLGAYKYFKSVQQFILHNLQNSPA